MEKKGDFHIHSTYSDGKFSPKELVQMYVNAGFDMISLTDHDTTMGCLEAMEFGKEMGITVIPGIEISTRHNEENVHILGYFNEKALSDPKLRDFINYKRERRTLRIHQMTKSLKEHFQIEIDADDLIERTKGMPGRPHIAQALVDAGHSPNLKSAFRKYLGDDSLIYRSNSSLTIKEGIDLIKGLGGLAVLAHPILLRKSNPITLISDYNFDGLEGNYSKNSNSDTWYYRKLCRKHHLVYTAGSDFHGTEPSSQDIFGTTFLEGEDLAAFVSKCAI